MLVWMFGARGNRTSERYWRVDSDAYPFCKRRSPTQKKVYAARREIQDSEYSRPTTMPRLMGNRISTSAPHSRFPGVLSA